MTAIQHRLMSLADHLAQVAEDNPTHPDLPTVLQTRAKILIELSRAESQKASLDYDEARLTAVKSAVQEALDRFLSAWPAVHKAWHAAGALEGKRNASLSTHGASPGEGKR